ncbi:MULTISPECIES: transglutaminase family protein [unclassified Leptospira]|uniref:transglutaminase-like domain-containing protein n=1 Tax=unclassified Leptospira TaxID=2633828 RepID=UPI0002BE66AF|nr:MULTISPECIES: transglutaminase domain-containing protein [unclassified Leptospira]EMJ97893.1 transglutaminase-like protein [Leptospira sp. B5-022]MCR1794651.1 transglutaminase domain-containing protein [Leptospira sp. id769339]
MNCLRLPLFSIPLFLCLFVVELASEPAYSSMKWEAAIPEIFSPSPLAPEEKIKSVQGSLLIGEELFLPANFPDTNGKNTGGLIIRNIKSGTTNRLDLKETVRGLAFDKEEGQIYVRLKKEIIILQNGSFEIKKKIPFYQTGVAWGNIGFLQGKLFEIRENKLILYDKETGTEIEQKDLPLPKVPFAFDCSGKEIFFWYSKDGTNLHSYDPILNRIKNSFTVHLGSKEAGKLSCFKNDLVVLSPESGVYQNLIRIGNDYYSGKEENLVLKGNLSYRFSPSRDMVRFNLKITPKENSPETEIAVAIPPQETSSQVLNDEKFYPNGKLTEDKQNNRTLIIPIPALSSGQTWEETVYSAKLVRYNIDSGLSRFQTPWEDWKVPNEWKQYLEDASVYKISDPEIVRIKEELKSTAPNVEEYIQAVYKYIRKNMVYKQDGKFDPAPTVLQNGHGSCTEHSYAQISLLRSAGIPARMAWNWLPVGEKVELNHKIAEVWHPSFGWIPMEPLAPPRSRAGLTYAKHIIFAVLNQPNHTIIKGGDTLANFTKPAAGATRSISIELLPEISHRSSKQNDTGTEEIYPKSNSVKNRILEKSEERIVE